MEKYNEGNRCSKCGAVATTKFVKSIGIDIEPTGLRRACIRCGYKWFEESLDVKE